MPHLPTLETLAPAHREELAAYTADAFACDPGAVAATLPLAPEPHVAAWRGYMARAEEVGVVGALREALVQLRFPIEAGTSEREDYRAATRRGEWPQDGPGLEFVAPERIRLELHEGAAGPIPVITAGDRRDFVALVQALTKRNEPAPVPDSMGATMIAGLVNWNRIAAHRAAWEATAPGDRAHATWNEAFQALSQDKPAYQDRLILLSTGPYSGVPGEALGLDAAEWLTLSHAVRLEHEYTHYFTRRALGSMRNNLLDELIADAMGLLAATGRFEAAWFLRFLGLEEYPRYREGGRAQNYRGNPPLSDEAFAGLQTLVVAAAHNLETFTRQADGRDPAWRARLVLALTAQTLDGLAMPDGAARIAAALPPA